MDIETIRRISLARQLYQLGVQSLRSTNDLQLFAAANLLQDAVEAFLLAVAEHVDATIDQNTKFDKYFVQIEKKIEPKELPFKLKLLRLNRIRVDSKHYGIQPTRDECDRLAVSVREFFDEVSDSLLGVSFSTVSALDLLEDGETKQLLGEAKLSLEKGDHETCVISCRKAVYLEVERWYDIVAYKDNDRPGLLAGFTYAPAYARSKDYIQREVHDPTDYIVRDHSQIDQDLLKQGVETTDFWNIWRLTPDVYKTKTGEWVVKHDFRKLEPDFVADKAEYIFSTAVDIVLAVHTNRKRTRTAGYGNYIVELERQNVPVYEKADSKSKVMGYTPPGMTKMATSFRVLGLNEDGLFWYVHDFENRLFGYIHRDDVKQS